MTGTVREEPVDVDNLPEGMMAFEVIKTRIKDSEGCYCDPGDLAVLDAKAAQHYQDLGMIKVALPDFAEAVAKKEADAALVAELEAAKVQLAELEAAKARIAELEALAEKGQADENDRASVGQSSEQSGTDDSASQPEPANGAEAKDAPKPDSGEGAKQPAAKPSGRKPRS